MNLRLAMAAPLPWLTVIAARLLGRKTAGTSKGARKGVFRFPRSLSVTTDGKWYIAILLIVGIAAINTGNNLLYLVVAMMLTVIIVSGVLSESSVRKVRVRRELPRQIFKGQPAMVRLKVINRKTWFPSFSLFTIEYPVPGLTTEWTYTLKLKPGGETIKTPRYTFARRGVVELSGVRVNTRFPFGIFVKGKVEEMVDTVVVYPDVELKHKKTLLETGRLSGSESSRMKGYGGSFYGLREYTLTDDARFIHWRSAARSSRLYYTEQEQETERAVMVVFNNYRSKNDEAFEDAVDEAAALANHYVKLGYRVGLKTLETEIPPGRGPQNLNTILHTLALVSPVATAGTASVRVRAL